VTIRPCGYSLAMMFEDQRAGVGYVLTFDGGGSEGGHTLLELLTALLVLAVLLAVTIPSYHGMARRQDARSGASVGRAALALVQLDALSRGERAELSLGADGVKVETGSRTRVFQGRLPGTVEANVASWVSPYSVTVRVVPPFGAPSQGGTVWLGDYGFVVRPVSGLTVGRQR